MPTRFSSILNEEESARFLREARKQGLNKPLIGETTLLGQKVIDLAGEAANGVRGHVGLTVDAPIQPCRSSPRNFKKRFNYACDHNGIKGYTAVYFIKHVTEKIGKFDSKAFAQAAHGITITPKDEPGILMEGTWDNNGDIDRISFLGEVVDGEAEDRRDLAETRQVIVQPRCSARCNHRAEAEGLRQWLLLFSFWYPASQPVQSTP